MHPTADRARRRHRAVVAVGLLVLLVVAGQAVAVLDGRLRPVLLTGTLLLLDTLGLVFGLRAGGQSNDLRTWRLIAVSRGLSAVSVFGWAVGGDRWWWVGTAAHLAMYGALAAGLLSAPTGPLHGRRLAAYLAEVVTVVGGGFMVVWYLRLGPALDPVTGQDTGLAAGQDAGAARWVAAIGFPAGDLLLLTAIAGLLLRGALTRAPRAVPFLMAGIVVLLVGEVGFGVLGIDAGPPSTACRLLSGLLMTGAVMVHALAAEGGDDVAVPPWASYFPYAALGGGYLLLVVVTVREWQLFPWGGLVFGLILMTGAVAVRQLISLRDSHELNVTDSLTGLANRAGLHDRLRHCVGRGQPVAVLLIDLDGFKGVNDAFGHQTGDTLLAEFAYVLRHAVRAGDLAARIGGDEFVLLLDDVTDLDPAVTTAQRILATIAANPIDVGLETLTVRASIGIALSVPDDTPKDLLRRADAAMYHAKRAGRHGWEAYQPGLADRRAGDDALAAELAVAVAEGQIRVLYQPLVALTTGLPLGAEALVRWEHPTRGTISPIEFIPAAERSGTITAIGLYVLEDACGRVRSWQRLLGGSCYASVNLSPRQLQEPTLVADVLAVLARTGLAPHDLVLEVTESAVVDEAVAIPALKALRSHGIRIAVDDFGTGYSSLHYLTRLPVDILKIDRSFVNELNGTPEGAAVTEAVIRLSQALHLRTVAEGIETTAQAEELLRLGCDTGQGYLYARPMPAPDVEALLTRSLTRSPR
jgi:diguanylate cyclase (GGDEF)-like protein